MRRYIGAIDQGTTSTRFIIFDDKGQIIIQAQKEHEQIFPRPGWVEHDIEEIWNNTEECIAEAMKKSGILPEEMVAIGITNHRETVVPFLRKSGRPLYNAIVWQDLRGEGCINKLKNVITEDEIRERTGLLYSPYFAGSKIRWLLDNVPKVRALAGKPELCFGTIDTYLVYKLTGRCITDVTNASRYMLMNLKTMNWDPIMMEILGISRENLPEIVSSTGEIYGYTDENGVFGARSPLC